MLIPKVMFVWVYFCKNDKSLIILKVLVFLFVELFNVELVWSYFVFHCLNCYTVNLRCLFLLFVIETIQLYSWFDYWLRCFNGHTILVAHFLNQRSCKTLQVWHVVRQMSQVYVKGLACGASDVTGLCHRFGMWCVRCHRFMSQVWHVVRQMSQVYVTSLACGASDVTGLCHRCGMWCVRCHRFMSQVWHVVRQMSQVYVTSLACGASDVTGLCHRCGMWCVRCHRFMSQVWHVVRQMSQIYVTGLACGASDVTGLACGASDVTGLCHRFCMRASEVMSRNVHGIALWKACVKVRHTSEWLV